MQPSWMVCANFYPRPPRGGRRGQRLAAAHLKKFLSTPSARRATGSVECPDDGVFLFLSTPSARRATSASRSGWWCPLHFYPRPPRGGRPSIPEAGADLVDISIHALREEGDHIVPAKTSLTFYFYPRPPRGGRPAPISIDSTIRAFLSTPSARRATAKTERKHPAFVSLYTSLHKLQRDVCKPNRKITPLLAQTAGFPVRSVPENHVCCRFALAGHQKISTLSWANSGCSPTCSTLVW